MLTSESFVATVYHTLLKIIVHLQSEKSVGSDSLRPRYQNLSR